VITTEGMQRRAARSKYSAVLRRVALTTTTVGVDAQVQLSYTELVYWSHCYKRAEPMDTEANALCGALCSTKELLRLRR
jgi:hypothetical protein